MTTKIDNKLEMIKWVICFALALVCLLIPEQGIVTMKFKLFLAITVWALALAAFELLPEMAIAIMMLGLWFFFGVADASVIMGSWVGTTMLMVAGTFFLGAALDDCGLLRRISYWIMCKVKGSYFKLLFFSNALWNSAKYSDKWASIYYNRGVGSRFVLFIK